MYTYPAWSDIKFAWCEYSFKEHYNIAIACVSHPILLRSVHTTENKFQSELGQENKTIHNDEKIKRFTIRFAFIWCESPLTEETKPVSSFASFYISTYTLYLQPMPIYNYANNNPYSVQWTFEFHYYTRCIHQLRLPFAFPNLMSPI